MKASILTFIALLPLTLVAISACGDSAAEGNKSLNGNGRKDAVTVSVLEITPSDYQETLQLTGSVASFEDVKVPSDEGGRVLQWLVSRGATVTRGQVLVQLDSALHRAGYDAALAQYNIAQTNFERQKKVYEQQGISELQLKTLQYQRDAAKAQMELSRERLERTRVRSPISGVLNMRYVEAGEMSAPGQPIAHVVNTERLKIEAGVPERYAGNFNLGDKVEFTVDAFPGHSFSGTVSFIGAAVNRDNRTIPVEVLVLGAGGKLKPAMIAAMRVTLESRSESIVIREDHIIKSDIDEYIVYIVDNDVARQRVISIGGSSQGKVLVASGLNVGDKLITLGNRSVADGQAVTVKHRSAD